MLAAGSSRISDAQGARKGQDAMHQTSDVHREGLHAALCQPEGGARAGLLLLPMVYGIEGKVLEYAGWLADAGYAALVWDPYSGREVPQGTPEDLAPLSRSLRDGPARAEHERWLDYLRDELGLARLGVVGWCMGGRFGLLLAAHSREVAACVAYYPSILAPRPPHHDEDAVARAGEIRCPVQVVYPGLDDVTHPDTFHALQAALQAREAPTITQLYPVAEHGFLDLTRHPGAQNAAAARAAGPPTLAFLHANLAGE
jgi:carboxymethylenebutenolidase